MPGWAADLWLVLVLGWCMGGALGGALSEPAPRGMCKANPHAPTGPTWANVAPKCCLAPLGVPRGRMEHKGPGARGFAGIPKLALMFA